MSTTTDMNDEMDESIKEWAKRLAAEAPPLSDDQLHQLHVLFARGAAPRPRLARPPRQEPGQDAA